jgi:hypothetical protein
LNWLIVDTDQENCHAEAVKTRFSYLQLLDGLLSLESCLGARCLSGPSRLCWPSWTFYARDLRHKHSEVTLSSRTKKKNINKLLEVASNFSERRFLRHFHGLKSLPRADSFDFLSTGGVLAFALPRLPVRTGPLPFIFLLSAGAVFVFDLLLLAEMKSVRDRDEAIICLFSWKLSCGVPFFDTPVCTHTRQIRLR